MSIACQCASIRPGMRVRPPPSMSVVVALRPVGIGLVETRSILFPRTRTFLGPDRAVLFPSKIRTFRNSVTASPDGVEGLAPGASCAWPAWQRLSRNAANTNGRYCPCFSVRIMCANLQYANLGLSLARSSPNAHAQRPGSEQRELAGRCSGLLGGFNQPGCHPGIHSCDSPDGQSFTRSADPPAPRAQG